jgi:antitoxin MazE
MITQLKKWGNSLAIRFPQSMLSQLNLKEDGEVEIRLEGNQMVLTPVSEKRPKYKLDDLLSEMTEENQQDLIDSGNPVGNEVW